MPTACGARDHTNLPSPFEPGDDVRTDRGEDGDLLFLPNTGQPATFSDLNLTHTAAVSVPLPSWVCFWPELAS